MEHYTNVEWVKAWTSQIHIHDESYNDHSITQIKETRDMKMSFGFPYRMSWMIVQRLIKTDYLYVE